jgi:hypothetical protein
MTRAADFDGFGRSADGIRKWMPITVIFKRVFGFVKGFCAIWPTGGRFPQVLGHGQVAARPGSLTTADSNFSYRRSASETG